MKKRIISAIVMLIICIPIIWFGGTVFRIGVGLISILALKELIDLKKSHREIPLVVQLLAVASQLLLILSEYDAYSILFGISYKGIAILLLALLLPTIYYKKDKYTTKDAFYLIGCVLLISTSFNTMILVRMFSLYKFLYLILIFILTDTFAYICGKAFGHHKLSSHVSPNKTIEGSVSGTIIAGVGASVFYHFLVAPVTIKAVIATFVLSIIGQFGDLIFSKIKRENEIKDFSNLIPGHGGILDRLDSTIAIMLGYLIFYTWI